MMKSNLNLLPPFKKDRLERLASFIFLKRILELVIVTISLLAVSFVWSYIVLRDHYISIADSVVRVNREFHAYNKDVRRINLLAQQVRFASKDFVPLLPRLLELASAQPPDIKLDTVQIDRRSKTFAISGTAQTRAALLRYQDVLRGISWISGVQAPISQLFQRENISFQFKTTITFPLNTQASPQRSQQPQPDDLSL